MRISRPVACIVFLLVVACHAAESWRIIDEGFQFRLPPGWSKVDVRGIDSHVGKYVGRTAYLEFDEVYGLGNTVEKSAAAIDQLKAAEADPRLLKPGEEIWRVDGKVARFKLESADPEIYGKREFKFVARLSVWYPGEPAGLGVYVFYESAQDLPTVRMILQSFAWPQKRPNKAPEPTPTSVTPPAAQESRRP